MSPKIIRRQREEPEVAAFVTIPKQYISTEFIKMSPEQVKHYNHWSDEFVAWFKEQFPRPYRRGAVLSGNHRIPSVIE
ncbi:MAG TPA: hypothetical protein VER35_00280 [Candidatus Limnocylindrales bacterium]|nr:hypothetical protein [Candidatus Limnocylindrales bacterium]